MIYKDNQVTDIHIAYIGGGSRGWAWTFMTDLALEPQMSGTIRLYDIQHEAAIQNEIIGNRISTREETVGHWSYKTVDSLKEALLGADFVVISILPGTFDEMEIDVHVPEKHGIFQSVGDTVGPGGLMRGLRAVPMFVEIASAIKQYSPDTWVINYTNPMSLCVKTLYKTFPKIKAFGCCHEVFGTQKILKGICEEVLGIENIKREEIEVNVLGINHFTWFDHASYKGLDLFPIYDAYIDAHLEEGYTMEIEKWADKCFACNHLVKFDLFKRFGLIAAAGDRHLAEFMPQENYLKDKEMISRWKYSLTTVEWRKRDYLKRLAKSRRLKDGLEDITLEPTGEEGILLIKALCGLERVISNVNIPNTCGQIANLEKDVIVETNAVFERDSIRPIFSGDIPDNILMILNPHIENQENIYQAAVQCDYELALKAMKNEPLIDNKLSDYQYELLLKEMIKGTINYLPGQWSKFISKLDK